MISFFFSHFFSLYVILIYFFVPDGQLFHWGYNFFGMIPEPVHIYDNNAGGALVNSGFFQNKKVVDFELQHNMCIALTGTILTLLNSFLSTHNFFYSCVLSIHFNNYYNYFLALFSSLTRGLPNILLWSSIG